MKNFCSVRQAGSEHYFLLWGIVSAPLARLSYENKWKSKRHKRVSPSKNLPYFLLLQNPKMQNGFCLDFGNSCWDLWTFLLFCLLVLSLYSLRAAVVGVEKVPLTPDTPGKPKQRLNLALKAKNAIFFVDAYLHGSLAGLTTPLIVTFVVKGSRAQQNRTLWITKSNTNVVSTAQSSANLSVKLPSFHWLQPRKLHRAGLHAAKHLYMCTMRWLACLDKGEGNSMFNSLAWVTVLNLWGTFSKWWGLLTCGEPTSTQKVLITHRFLSFWAVSLVKSIHKKFKRAHWKWSLFSLGCFFNRLNGSFKTIKTKQLSWE